MCKEDIFNEIIQVVSRETEISPRIILSGSKETEVVDARYFLVYFLSKEGFNISSRVRCGKMMGIYLERIGNELGKD